MVDFEFSIPLHLEDLQKKQGPRDYVVEEVFRLGILSSKLENLKTTLRQFEKDTVINHFDTLYSVLSCDKALKEKLIQDTAWSCLMKCLENLSIALKRHMDSGSSVRDGALRNSLMMAVYLTTEMINLLEGKPSIDQIVAGNKKKSKGKAKDVDFSWTKERDGAITSLTQLLSLPVQRLWDPPIVDQSLIDCVGKCCFKLLQNAGTLKSKETKDGTIMLLGTLIKRHKYTSGAALQIMECLRLHEHMASHMAEALTVFHREFSSPDITHEVIREISKLSSDYLQKDVAAARSYSTFLIDLGELLPDVIFPVISWLLPFLEDDPHVMRNAILSVIGCLVMNVLTGENISDKNKEVREECMDIICEHLMDRNSFVRAKSLQVLKMLVESSTIPLSRYIELTELAKGRLNDKLSNVRRYAIQLMSTLISHNPYGATLTDVHLNSAYETEKKKLADIKQQLGDAMPDKAAVITPQENWDAMLPEIEKMVSKLAGRSDESGLLEDMEESADDEEDLMSQDKITEEIISLLNRCQHRAAIQLLLKAQQHYAGTPLEMEPLDEEEQNAESRVLDKLKEIFLSQKSEADTEEVSGNAVEINELREQYNQQSTKVHYLEQMIKFCNLVQSSFNLVCKLLTSKAPTDVCESINFVLTTVQFGVTESANGLAIMVKLVWVEDANIKAAVLHAFRQLYLFGDEADSHRDADKVVSHLIELTRIFSETFGLLTSWEQLVAEFVKSGDISSKAFQILWQTFTMKSHKTTPEESKIALRLISMAGRAQPAIISSNMDVLLSEGLGSRASSDFLMARDVCLAYLALTQIANKSAGDKAATRKQRLPQDGDLVKSLINLLSIGITDTTQNGWIPLMEQAIKVFYELTDLPDKTCIELIRDIYPRCILSHTKKISFAVLARFVSLVGHVAFCQMAYMETDVLQELKATRQSEKDKTTASTAGTEELGSATTDDVETDFVMKAVESELLDGRNLLACFLPLITHILLNRDSYDDKALQCAAILSMGKYMLINRTVCKQNLRLYFTVLERSHYPEVKSNALIALSDMVFKFPNELEPWTPNLYSRLRDESVITRKSALMIMTRLIHNDMIKVKGHISEIATCMVDEDNSVKKMASQFFLELSNKGKTLYNVLLDIVSRLSDPDVGVSEEKFRHICTELFSHISNDKQSESLMERFVLRFRATTDERQWRDLAFCLSKLTYNEKCIKKLIEHFSCYADKLADEEVYDSFKTVISQATTRLKLKPESKEILQELANKIDMAHNRGVEDMELIENADAVTSADMSQSSKSQSVLKPSKGGKKNTSKRTRSSRKPRADDSGSGSDDSDTSHMSNRSVTQPPASARRSARKAGVMKPLDNLLAQLAEDSDEDQDPDNFTRDAPKESKKNAAKKAFVLSSSEEEEVSSDAIVTPLRSQRRTRARAVSKK